ncbi:MAG: phosphoadenylyl-sulfate reductase [Elainellaceae cyanobacterium]
MTCTSPLIRRNETTQKLASPRAVSLYRGSRDALSTLIADYRIALERDPAARSWLEVLLCYPGPQAIALHRLAHWLHQRNLPLVPRLVSHLSRFLTGIEIHPGATIGQEVFIDHGAGVVIGETATVGDRSVIYQGVTLGGTGKNADEKNGRRHPSLGHGVLVGAGAKILGPITLGDGARVGAGAVVVRDIPENTTAVGIPARNMAHQTDPISKSTTIQIEDMADKSATDLVQWAADQFGDGLVMSTSFGIQSAVMLHLVTQVVPDVPVIWVDTGYLPQETYRFADELTRRLNLNLKVYQSPLSPARMEAQYGQLWAQKDLAALNQYDQIRKVVPMQRALRELKATAWLAGLRQQQTDYRQSLERVVQQDGIYKIHPILGWNARDVYQYLTAHDLPYHPFFDQGYVTVGDWHSSRPLTVEDTDERSTRFHGLKQECGLHLT